LRRWSMIFFTPRTNSCRCPCFTTPREKRYAAIVLAERLCQIGDQVVGVLESDREPDHTLVHSGAGKLLARVPRMAEEDGKRGDRFRSAQACGAGDEPLPVPEPEGALLLAEREG